MNTKTLVLAVAKQTELPVSQVEAVVGVALRKFSELVETQGKFRSPLLEFDAVMTSAKPATDETPARPERKFARLRLPARPRK